MSIKQKARSVLELFRAPVLQEPVPTVFVPRTDESALITICTTYGGGWKQWDDPYV